MKDDAKRIDMLRLKAQADRIEDSSLLRERKAKYLELGLCAKCRHLHAETSRYGNKKYWCTDPGERIRRLSDNDPITDCTDFWDISHMTLKELVDMAIPIDIHKRPIGFVREFDDEDEIDLMMLGEENV